MNNKNWGNRDWIWLVGILIMIIILLIAGFYNSKVIELNFSIISSAVSIALALVAIFFAFKQDSDNQRVTSEMANILTKIESKVNSMDGKIDNLDPNLITRPVQEKLIKEIHEIINSHQEGENNEKIAEIVKAVNENFNEINNDLQLYYDTDTPNKLDKYKILISVPNDEAVVNKFVYELANILELNGFTYTHSNEILKFYYVGNKLVRYEILDKLLKKYEGFYLIDWGIDGNIKSA
ncbi:hypothetical protein [Bacillus paramycoides]|uniref:hypothetical protein n=1 Tax=Bacillus paramycoides TaxID=2026194 RepID=UPI002E1C6A91|nr:hypothetical protein [Bacillus paramycoides]